MEWDDIFGEDDYWLRMADSTPAKREMPKRTVEYKGPGHTIVRYKHRVLDITFPQSQKRYDALRKKRRSQAAKQGAKNRHTHYSGTLTRTQSNIRDKGVRRIHEKQIKNDYYEIGDMRALLKDAHWEEVCGHKRWMIDNKALVKEFKKYQMEYQRMY